MTRIIILFGILAMRSNAAVVGFVESFEGNAYSDNASIQGFDNLNWKLDGEGGIRNGVFQMTNSPSFSEELTATLYRSIEGFGGFRESLDFSIVDLGDYTLGQLDIGANSLVHFSHLFVGQNGNLFSGVSAGLQELIRPSDVDDNTNWLFYATAGNSSASMWVPKSLTHSSLVIVHDADTADTRFLYDDNPFDERAPYVLGPLSFRSPSLDSETSVAVSSSHGAISVVGIDTWSLEAFPFVAKGDFDESGILDVLDLEMLQNAIHQHDMSLDLNSDKITNFIDLEYWVHELFGTFFGDSNLDGEFNSADLVNVFVTGEYEDAIDGNSTWATGDWSGNGEFDSADLVLAFQDGGYELGPREAVRSVPEPNESGAAVLLGFVIVWLVLRRRFMA